MLSWEDKYLLQLMFGKRHIQNFVVLYNSPNPFLEVDLLCTAIIQTSHEVIQLHFSCNLNNMQDTQ